MKSADQSTDSPQRQGAGYPYMALGICLKVSDAMREVGGARAEVQKSVLASQMDEDENSGAFSQRITSAKIFGLIEGYRAYSLTEIAKQYYFPTSDSSKSSALLQIFASPPAFKELVRRFDGSKLPTKEILSNILHRELGVPDSWKERVAAIFSNSAQFAGVIDSQGFLRFNAALSNNKPAPLPPGFTPPEPCPILGGPDANESQSPMNAKSNERDVSRMVYNGEFIEISTPVPLAPPLWEKLNRWVQSLKPERANEDKGF